MGRVVLAQHGFALVVQVEVDQRQLDGRMPAGLTHQMAVNLCLRPVQALLLGGDRLKLAAIGLDLFNEVPSGVITVGPTAHGQWAVLAAADHLAPGVGPPPAGHQCMAGQAFLPGGGRTKAQVEVASAGGEFAQFTHAHHIAGADRICRAGHGSEMVAKRRAGCRLGFIF